MRGHRTSKFLAAGFGLMVILATAWYFVRSRAPSNQLNVILVTLDTTRADRIGSYGYSSAQTPVIDALAKSGTLFEFARTPYPLTLPSHASLFSGLNPPEHGLRVNGRGRLSAHIPVLSEILHKANYETGAFIAAYVLNSKFGLDRGFDTYDGDLTISAHQTELSERWRDGRLVMDSALGWLQQRGSHPFFCWIHLYDAHGPANPRTKIFGDTFKQQPYDAGIAYEDLQLARLQEFLTKAKLKERTLLVVVGDHGEGLMEHTEPEHGYQLYDSTLHVPLIFAGPPWVKSGSRASTPVSLIDLMPTILDCLNIPLPQSVSGRSVKSALIGEQLASIPCYAESELAFLESRCAPLRSVTTERWKFIETTRPELYDLSADPQEVENLASSEPDRVQELLNILEELCERMKPTTAESVNLSADEKRILASLGYVAGAGSTKPPAPGDRLTDVKDLMPQFVRFSEAQAQAAKDDSSAIETLHAILKDAPGYATARLFLGDLLLRQKQFSAAEKEYSTVIDDQPDNHEAHGSLGNALAAQGRFEDATNHFRKALEIEPSNSSYHYYYAFTLARLGKADEAIHELQEAVRCNPAFVDARLPLSKLLSETGRMGEAVQEYEAARKYRPDLDHPAWIPKQKKRNR